jgi:hypothetical protein
MIFLAIFIKASEIIFAKLKSSLMLFAKKENGIEMGEIGLLMHASG